MDKSLSRLFDDSKLINKIKAKLPLMFHIAEIESSRAGKIGIEVGINKRKDYYCPINI